MSGLFDEIIYRDFEEKDIDEVALILESTWWEDLAPKGLEKEVGIIDLANYARRVTFARVAEYGGHVVGVIAARAGDSDQETKDYWKTFSDDACAKLKSQLGDELNRLTGYYDFEERVHNKMHEESEHDLSYELVLFAVSSQARGKGVGTSLLRFAVEYLKGQGAQSAFLYTDSTCDWQYYEKRGMERTAEYKSTPDEVADGRPEELYIYSCNL